MQRFDLIERLKIAEDGVSSINEELKAFVSKFVETHRTFKNGQKVEVFDFTDKSYGVGFVRLCTSDVSFRWGSLANQYASSKERWLKDLSDIMYEVVKAKKDGTPSERVLMWYKPRQEKRAGEYHLKAVE